MNDSRLDQIRTAASNPVFWQPVLIKPDESLLETRYLLNPPLNESSSLLTVRSILRSRDGEADQAWQDILGVMRLSRLMSQEFCLLLIVSSYLGDIRAAHAINEWLNCDTLTEQALHQAKADLEQFFPLRPAIRGMHLEHLVIAQFVQQLAYGKAPATPLNTTFDLRLTNLLVDWDRVLVETTYRFNEFEQIMSLPKHSIRRERFKSMDQELFREQYLLWSSIPSTKRMIALAMRLLPATEAVRTLQDSAIASRRASLAAVSCRLYRLKHGSWPERLPDLVPEFLDAVPRDLFDDNPLRYRVLGDIVFLWSINENERDDFGPILEGKGQLEQPEYNIEDLMAGGVISGDDGELQLPSDLLPPASIGDERIQDLDDRNCLLILKARPSK